MGLDYGRCFGALLWSLMIGATSLSGAVPEESPSWLYRAWQTDDGLPDNCVTGVAQAADGYLWVGTRGGLLRFNGVDFKAMPLLSLPGVPNRVVHSMFQDRRGRMWLGIERGPVVCLDPQGAKTYGEAQGLPDTKITNIAEDGDGALWIAFSNDLCRIMDGRCDSFGDTDGFPQSGGANWVTSDVKGELWFARGNRVGVFRDGKMQAKLTFKDSSVRLCASASSGIWICEGDRLLKYVEGEALEERGRLPRKIEPRVIFEDRAGAVWVGTAGDGLFRIHNGVVEKIATSHQEVDCLSEDREGNLWAGTNGGGLNLVRPRNVALVGRQAGLPAESVRSVCEDKHGCLWATLQNGMLARCRNGRWSEVGSSAGWPGGNATCVAADDLGGVWVGTRDQGLNYQIGGLWRNFGRADGLVSDSVRSILVAKNGDVWAAADSPRRLQLLRGGKVDAMETPGDIRSIRAMAEGADGTIWIGTAEGQILRVSGQSLVSDPAVTAANPGSVRSLLTTPDGALWIGYAGDGVGRLKNGKYSLINSAKGLMDDYASQIFADGRGAMWVLGNHGLFKVELSEMEDVAEGRAERVRSRVFGRSEGLAGLQPDYDYFPAVCRAQDGRLWFAMRSGLLMVQPDKIRDNPTPPPVVLERVSVDDQVVALRDTRLHAPAPGSGPMVDLLAGRDLHLSPGHRKLEFEFAALSFTNPESVHFRYRLKNFDKQWMEVGTQRAAIYPQLPAGDYVFSVIACNNAGVWNEKGATLAFTVAPSFWQTWWFRIGGLVLFTAALIKAVRYVSFRRLREKMRGLEQQAALNKERVRIARDMHDEVGAKLTRLSLLGDMACSHSELSPTAQADVLEISETARETILAFDEIVWAVNPRNDTLDDLIHYLSRHAEEFFDVCATQCVFDLPKVIPSIMLSTEVRHQVFLSAKEALNNAVKHAKARQVSVRLVLHPAAFELLIEDDGLGFVPDTPSKRAAGGNGMVNMQERIESISGRFVCVSQPGQGTRISFYVSTP